MSISYPSDSRPHIQMRHIDGPVLWMRDGRAHWLTIWERIAVRFGWQDAYSLERKYWGGSNG